LARDGDAASAAAATALCDGIDSGDDELETYEGVAANSTPPFLLFFISPTVSVVFVSAAVAAAAATDFWVPPFFEPKITAANPLNIKYPQYKFKTLGNTNALLATRTSSGKPESAECGVETLMAHRL